MKVLLGKIPKKHFQTLLDFLCSVTWTHPSNATQLEAMVLLMCLMHYSPLYTKNKIK